MQGIVANYGFHPTLRLVDDVLNDGSALFAMLTDGTVLYRYSILMNWWMKRSDHVVHLRVPESFEVFRNVSAIYVSGQVSLDWNAGIGMLVM